MEVHRLATGSGMSDLCVNLRFQGALPGLSFRAVGSVRVIVISMHRGGSLGTVFRDACHDALHDKQKSQKNPRTNRLDVADYAIDNLMTYYRL